MPSRYTGTPFFRNRNPLYDRMFEDRGVKFISQYGTSEFEPLTQAQKQSLAVEQVKWQTSSRLEKMASLHYGDPTYWWVIARYNQKPTDFHYNPGDVVYIPKPLDRILLYYLG